VPALLEHEIRYDKYHPIKRPLPLLIVLANISIEIEPLNVMNIKLLSPEVHLHLQEEDENDYHVLKNMEQEIECPRCNDIMTLSSDFDNLGYVCQECDLLLVME
jgi:hypothetical protein